MGVWERFSRLSPPAIYYRWRQAGEQQTLRPWSMAPGAEQPMAPRAENIAAPWSIGLLTGLTLKGGPKSSTGSSCQWDVQAYLNGEIYVHRWSGYTPKAGSSCATILYPLSPQGQGEAPRGSDETVSNNQRDCQFFELTWRYVVVYVHYRGAGTMHDAIIAWCTRICDVESNRGKDRWLLH
jgi:hypothetical protein